MESIESVADWIEIEFIVDEKKRLSRSYLRRKLGAHRFPGDGDIDYRIDFITAEFDRRRRRLGDKYLLQRAGSSWSSPDWRAAWVYTFMLTLCTSEDLRESQRFSEVDRLFDELVGNASAAVFGSKGKYVRFGWPPSGNRPSKFRMALEWLGEQLNIEAGPGARRNESKDAGVDIVVWRHFEDKRLGFPILLVQCTVADRWEAKAKDIVPDVWRGFLDTGKEPYTALAVPFVVPKEFSKWDEINRTVNILLCRERICELAESFRHGVEGSTIDWVERELAAMAARSES